LRILGTEENVVAVGRARVDILGRNGAHATGAVDQNDGLAEFFFHRRCKNASEVVGGAACARHDRGLDIAGGIILSRNSAGHQGQGSNGKSSLQHTVPPECWSPFGSKCDESGVAPHPLMAFVEDIREESFVCNTERIPGCERKLSLATLRLALDGTGGILK